MKRFSVIVGLVLLIGSCAVNQAPVILDGRILFLGDSITQDGRYVSIIEYELFRHYPDSDVDVISIGLSSETVSGLTEPEHPYPRPNAHERLGRALEAIKPKTVFACYGMNDGIYHPQNEDRLKAYQDGIHKLIEDVRATGARLIILTPPIFDAQVIPEKTVSFDSETFGYPSPYEGYNDVLADYADWLLSLDLPDVQVIDLNGPMLAYTKQQRVENPEFAFSGDGVHPQFVGHALMALQVLTGFGIFEETVDPRDYAEQLESEQLYKRVQERRRMRSTAWLVDIGYIKPGKPKALPVEDAEEKAKAEKKHILDFMRQMPK